jgi:hypothetical protein
MFLEADLVTGNKSRCDYARILVYICWLALINYIKEILIDGRVHHIKLMEGGGLYLEMMFSYMVNVLSMIHLT